MRLRNDLLGKLVLLTPILVLGTACVRQAKLTPFPAGMADAHLDGDMAFSPDGKTLAVANYDGVVKLLDVATGKAQDLPSPFPYAEGPDSYNNVVYSKGGQLLAVAYEQRAIVVRDVPGRKEKVRIPLEGAGVHSMAFTDGDRVLVALLMSFTEERPRPDGRRPLTWLAVRWDVSSGKRQSIVDFGWYCDFKVLSPDGRYAVAEFTTKPGTLPNEDRYQVIGLATGAKLFQVGGMDFDPDWGLLAGSWVFSGDGSTQVTCNQRGLLIREVPSGRELKHIDNNLIATTHGAVPLFRR